MSMVKNQTNSKKRKVTGMNSWKRKKLVTQMRNKSSKIVMSK